MKSFNWKMALILALVAGLSISCGKDKPKPVARTGSSGGSGGGASGSGSDAFKKNFFQPKPFGKYAKSGAQVTTGICVEKFMFVANPTKRAALERHWKATHKSTPRNVTKLKDCRTTRPSSYCLMEGTVSEVVGGEKITGKGYEIVYLYEDSLPSHDMVVDGNICSSAVGTMGSAGMSVDKYKLVKLK